MDKGVDLSIPNAFDSKNPSFFSAKNPKVSYLTSDEFKGKIASGGKKWKKEEQLVKERWSKKFDFRDKRHA